MRFAEVSDRAVTLMGRLPSAVIEWLGRVPTTNLRIVTTLFVFVATAARYLASGLWTPSMEWLAFLVAMAGVDTLAFIGKRKTQHPTAPGEP